MRDEFDPPEFDEDREQNRDDFTIFVHQIHPKVDDRDLFDFFSHVGRVLDIRLIRDQRTLKSKGLAYIEFWQRESVSKAISLNGCALGGYPISIQITQSEANETGELPDIPMRLYVGSLHPDVGENDLRPLFEAFGPIESLALAKEPDGASKGFAYVTFRKEADAKQALSSLDELELAGRPIKVGVVDVAQTSYLDSAGELDEGGGLTMTAQKRQALMANLQRGSGGQALGGGGAAPTPQFQPRAVAAPMIQATSCIVVKNMFDPAVDGKDPDFDLDIKEDIEDECAKYGIKFIHIHVDKQHKDGHVFLRFNNVPDCQKIASAFHGRWFASRQIIAEYVPETTYLTRFPR